MQEEVENRTLTLVVSGTKFTGRLLKAAITKYLAHRKEKKLQKQRSRDAPVKPQGKQTVKQLIGQNQGVSNIEITDPSIKEFEKIARKYGVDYAVKKDRSSSPPKYLIFFKGRDADALTAAFTEYTGKKVRKAAEIRAPVRAGKAEPVQRAGETRRRGPEQAKGAGTMKMKKQLDIKKLLVAESALYPDGACSPPTSVKDGGWPWVRTLRQKCFRSSPRCRWRWPAGGPACTRWTCWWGCAAALACDWPCISKARTPRSTGTVWSMAAPAGAPMRTSHPTSTRCSRTM